MQTQIDISIVICTYNRAAMLRRALQSLAVQRGGTQLRYEVIVIDDGSTDDTEAVVREANRCSTHQVTYIRETGIGVAAARNAGIRAAHGDWIAFTDDDQLADPDWLRELWMAQQRSGGICVGGSRTLELPTQVLETLSRQVRLILGEITIGGDLRACSRDALICTGNMLVRRSVLERLGGFDESLTQGGEDTDLFMRLRCAGYECWYTPAATVRHMIPAYRLEMPYLLWASRRGGECYAERDFREWGMARSWVASAARVIHAGTFHVPNYLWALMTRNAAEVTGRRCSLTRTLGYAVRVWRLTIAQKSHKTAASGIEFRSERNLFRGNGAGKSSCA